jgi:tRNA A37 threonylcarbamoyladenosine dehydratase
MQADLRRRFSGSERLYGLEAHTAVCEAHVAVVGIGGVGSWAAEGLVRSGVGKLTLMDLDHISESNVNRQVHAVTSTMGMAKVLAMAQRIEAINPACSVNCLEEFVSSANWPNLLPNGVDAVIDCCDQVSAKTVLAAWARHSNVLFVTVGAAGGKRHAHLVDVADLAETTHDPLLAKVRYNLRRTHGAPKVGAKTGINCVFSREPVQLAPELCGVSQDSTLNCHGYGSVVSVTATFGLCAAGWMIDKISRTSASADRKTIQSKASRK